MDLVLRICDDIVLDQLWAKLAPLTVDMANASVVLPLARSSSWTQLVSHHKQHLIHGHENISSVSYSAWPRDYIPRQLLSLSLITIIGIHLLYFLFAGFSYYFVFDHAMMRHPRFLPNQVSQEIKTSLRGFPGMLALTLPFFQLEVMGYTKLYDGLDTYGWAYLGFSIIWFLLFTDYCIYWIHRWLHLPFIYKYIHKPHHKWIIPTPFASHAFHPVDGWAQSLPYHIFIFLFPIHRTLYLILFVLVNCWSIFIHDSDMITGHPLEHVINGPAHHTLHHLYFTVNYGQYFTWADRTYKSYRHPDSSLDPLLEVKMHDKSE